MLYIFEKVKEEMEIFLENLAEQLDFYLDPKVVNRYIDDWRETRKVRLFLNNFGDLRVEMPVEKDAPIKFETVFKEYNEDLLKLLSSLIQKKNFDNYLCKDKVTYIDLVHLFEKVVDYENNLTTVDLSPIIGDCTPVGSKAGKVIRKILTKRKLTPLIKQVNIYYYSYLEAIDELNSEDLKQLIDILVTFISQFKQVIEKKPLKCVISVHPVDILTASIGTTGWYSCFDITDGEFKAAPFSILLDNNTGIAYAYNTYTEVLGLKIPKKAFRQWVTLVGDNNKNILYGAIFGRRYPCANEHIEKTIRKITANILAKNAGVESSYIKRKDTVFDTVTSSWVYYDEPTTAIILKEFYNNYGDLFMQGRLGEHYIYCLSCGEKRHDGDHDSLLCCDLTCCECGSIVRKGDVKFNSDGDVYCSDCYQELYTVCENCGEEVRRDVSYYISDLDKTVCESCFNCFYHVCNCCYNSVSEVFEVNTEDGYILYVCKECLNDYHYCEYCNQYYETIHIAYEKEGNGDREVEVCKNCLDKNFTECSCCNRYVSLVYETVNGDYLCESCYEHEEMEEIA